MSNPDDELRADMAARTVMAVPRQVSGDKYGILGEGRVLLLYVNEAKLEKAYIVEHGDKNLPGRFVYEHMVGAELLYQTYAVRSDELMFMERIESMLRERGIGLQYPTEPDHVWLQPDQFELAPIPTDWKVFADEPSGCQVRRDRFYGFGDSGSIAGSFDGYETREACIVALKGEWPGEPIGTTPEELGSVMSCALSGDEYVNRLQTLDGEGARFYGEFVG